MYVTAHRVVSPRGVEGINAFLHLHGRSFAWPAEPWRLPETEPGEVAFSDVEVAPGGNRVCSYLDVLAPDDTPSSEIEAALTGLWIELRADQELPPPEPLPNPVVYRRAGVVLRYAVEDASDDRLEEFDRLRTRVEAALDHRHAASPAG